MPLITGLVIAFSDTVMARKAKKLKETGVLVYASIIEVVKNTKYSVNNRHPYIIICQWTDPATNKVYTFKSSNFWTSPEPVIATRNISFLPVYIDQKKPQRYWVCIDEIQKYMHQSK